MEGSNNKDPRESYSREMRVLLGNNGEIIDVNSCPIINATRNSRPASADSGENAGTRNSARFTSHYGSLFTRINPRNAHSRDWRDLTDNNERYERYELASILSLNAPICIDVVITSREDHFFFVVLCSDHSILKDKWANLLQREANGKFRTAP